MAQLMMVAREHPLPGLFILEWWNGNAQQVYIILVIVHNQGKRRVTNP